MGCLALSVCLTSANTTESKTLIVEEYELGSTKELALEDLERLQVWSDSSIISRRAEWRSTKAMANLIYQHQLYSEVCVLELPSKIVTLEILERETVGMEEEIHVLVSEDDQTRCDIIARGSPVAGAFQIAYAWKDSYVIEFIDVVYVNCINQNEASGYPAVFHYRILNGHVLFLFRDENDQYGLSYNGNTVSNTYDDIVRYKCCGFTPLNPGSSDRMAWFYGQRDGQWFYVEAGIFE